MPIRLAAWFWHRLPELGRELERLMPEVALDIGEDSFAAPVEPVKRRQRRPSVASVVRQMRRAGLEVAASEIKPDGTVRLISGKAAGMRAENDRNEWDDVQ
jgi:hypothetical protein